MKTLLECNTPKPRVPQPWREMEHGVFYGGRENHGLFLV